MKCIFFYGLFMDVDLLRGMGFAPIPVAPAKLTGYRIHIGNKAALAPDEQATCYGMLIALSDAEASALYSAPGVRDYRAESVRTVRLDNGGVQDARCYNLPADQLGEEFNSEYAGKLSTLLVELGFPPEYASEIMQRGDA